MNIQQIINEIQKGIDEANKHFKKNNTKAKAYKPINVTVKNKAA